MSFKKVQVNSIKMVDKILFIKRLNLIIQSTENDKHKNTVDSRYLDLAYLE